MILFLLLTIPSVKGQRNDSLPVGPPERYYRNFELEVNDSSDTKSDSLKFERDSLFIKKHFPKDLRLQLPPFNNNRFLTDNMVIYPGHSTDPMPNANVKTPGVKYELKIVGIQRYRIPYNKGNNPYFRKHQKFLPK